MSATRFHHLTVCLACCLVCSFLQMFYVEFVDWQWWALNLTFAYAMQPFINIVRRRLPKWPRRSAVDPYVLVGIESVQP